MAPEAVVDLQRLKSQIRSQVRNDIETHLRHEPKKTSKSRIKRLKGVSHPQFRLRVGDDLRVFYDVTENTVEVLAIVLKSDADDWLRNNGESDEESGPDGNER